MWHTIDGVELNGEPPDLGGQTCQAFLCEQYWFEGKLEATANVTFLRFDGRWHRLYFDCGIVFWRRQDDEPASWASPAEGFACPLIDVGREAGVVGSCLAEYRMEPTAGGSRVTFAFDGGRVVVLDNHGDRTSYAAT